MASPPGFEHAPAFLDERPAVGCVLHDAVCENEIERAVGVRQMLAVGFAKVRFEALLREVLSGERDRRRRDIDATDEGAAFREANEIGTGAAADVEHTFAAIAVEVHETQEVVQLLEVILVEIGEEGAGPWRLSADLEIVDVLVPVVADVGGGGGTRGRHRPLL